jgi:hypothetical protein
MTKTVKEKKMALTKFKTFLEQAPAKDYVPTKDGDEEATGMEPRSKGERDFKAKHTVKKTGHPAASDKQFKTEDVELDEISKKTLGSYVKQASHDVAAKGAATRQFANDSEAARKDQRYNDAKKSMDRADKTFAKSWKRREGMAKAVDRLTKEDVESIDELSRDTLTSYSKAASKEVHRDLRDAGGARDKAAEKKKHGDTKAAADWSDEASWLDKRAKKRQTGMTKAVDRLTKEDVEQIDEIEAVGRADIKVSPSGRKVRKLVRFKNSSDAADTERKEKGEE